MPQRPCHIAIIAPAVARRLLDGTKTIESRFSRTRRPPFGCVGAGDRVVFKLSGGPCVVDARVRRVQEFTNLTPRSVNSLRRRWNALVAADQAYWRRRLGCRFGVLVWLESVRPIRGVRRVPRQFGNGWIPAG